MGFNFGGSNSKSKAGASFNFGANSAPEPGGDGDPLKDVVYTGDLQADSAAELEALKKGMADRAKAEADRFKKATDSEHWFAVCFKSREEKEAFLRAMKLSKKFMGDKYLDGHKWAKMLDIDLGSDD